LNDAFCNENSPLELKYIEGVGLGVFAKTDLKKKHDNEKLRSLLTGIVNLKIFEGVEWSNVIGKVTMNNGKKKEMKKNLLGPLDFVNHSCIGHSNCKLVGDHGDINYWIKMEKNIKKGQQIVMSYSFGSQMKCIFSDKHKYKS